ncbi:MAG: UbiA prenyltransferase family protein [Cyclobacteriaceae bacterium]|nr:UbiA prenyltransferase family protein [Cyclobacteriaceae bacterium]UYN85838.1 MAG: UbiA prenyltransferase family protein [Cyclobacteriaceae bacterium]
MRPIIHLIRPTHWIKNLFLLIPTFFAGSIFQVERLEIIILGIIAFSLIASAVYILNDLKDIEVDRIHPLKKDRPLASRAVSRSTATVLLVIFTASGLLLSYLLNPVFLILLSCYLVLNIAYSFGLKNIPIVDLFIVSLGFLIRIYSGGVLSGVEVSHWLSIMVLLLSLFLVLAKRRDDLVLQATSSSVIRKTSSSYNLEFINACLTIFAAVIVVSYIMYTVSAEVIAHFNSSYLFATTVFVIAGIMRYLQITLVEQNSGSPTSILVKDKFILITILLWIISFYIIIYY